MDKNNLICYITDEKVEDMKEWREKYKEELKGTPKKVTNYRDPDVTYTEKNSLFYNNMAVFLNEREAKYSARLNGKFVYKFSSDYPGGIEVKDEKDNFLFKLRSDQLGFSAPSESKNHPYDIYIKNADYKEEAYEKVASWVTLSRTIGGSFLWPIRKCADGKSKTEYNYDRGGSIGPRNKVYYIQDRVDLTLLEIKHTFDPFYEQKFSEDRLYRYYIDDKNNGVYEETYIKKWLKHFGTFKNYIEFFKFDDFVNTESLMPFDITKIDSKIDSHNYEPSLTSESNFSLNYS